MKVYRVVERRHGKVCELLDTAPVLEGLARAFARAALKRALDDLPRLGSPGRGLQPAARRSRRGLGSRPSSPAWRICRRGWRRSIADALGRPGQARLSLAAATRHERNMLPPRRIRRAGRRRNSVWINAKGSPKAAPP